MAGNTGGQEVKEYNIKQGVGDKMITPNGNLSISQNLCLQSVSASCLKNIE